jgi:DNA-binding transcriptional ArsR family regulator
VSTVERTEEKRVDQQLAALVGCSKTIEVLTVLTERTASPKELGSLLGLSIPVASHHAKKLASFGMVELVEEREEGSAVEHFYRGVVRPLISNQVWRGLSVAERQRFSIWIVQLVLADAARSFDAALFDACPNNHLSRTAMLLDRQGYDEVAEIQDRALDEIFAVEKLSGERIVAGSEDTAVVVAAMMCFELPDAGGPHEEVKRMKIQEVPSTVPAVAIRKSN